MYIVTFTFLCCGISLEILLKLIIHINNNFKKKS